MGVQLLARRQRSDGLHLFCADGSTLHQATLDLQVLVGLSEFLDGLSGSSHVGAGKHECAGAMQHVVERRQLGLSQGDAHNGVLVHLHGCAGLANSATQSLDFLHGQTAGVDNPDSTGTLEIFLDRGEHRLILCVRHVLHLLLPQTRVPPHAGGVALEKKNDPCRPQTQGSLKCDT